MTSIVVLMTSFNRAELTVRCIRKLFESARVPGVEIRVILVDASSNDGTVEMVERLSEDVEIHTVGSDHYWAMGMRVAWNAAQSSAYDYLLWLNDDVLLADGALEKLLSVANSFGNQAVVVGAVQSQVDNSITYSGFEHSSNIFPLRLRHVLPGSDPRQCSTLNGNIVLSPAECDRKIGGFPQGYSHALADLAYGFDMVRSGIKIYLAPGIAGNCERQAPDDRWRDPNYPLLERFRILKSPKGLPISSWFRFCFRYGGPFGVAIAAKPYLQLVMTSIGVRKR